MAVARAIAFTALCGNGVAAACGGRTPPDPQMAAVDPGLPPGTVHRRDLACGCAIRHDGTAWCWGDWSNPFEIAELGKNLAAVSDYADVAIEKDGTLWDRHGAGDPLAPREIASLGKTVVDVDIASRFTICVQTADGSLWCWGYNDVGELGDGTHDRLPPRTSPERVSALGANVAFAAGGGDLFPMSCAVTRDGVLWCWGADGLYGGVTAIDDEKFCLGVPCSPSPRTIDGIGKPVASVGIDRSPQGDFMCALTRGGEVWCWGMDYRGQLGGVEGGDTCPFVGQDAPCRKTPGKVPALGNDVAAISVGSGAACARKKDGSLWCWGENYWGQVGVGSSGQYTYVTPVQVAALGNEVADVVACDEFTCARKTDGTLWCWGHNNRGQLGDGTTQDSAVPVKVLGDWP